MQVFDWTRHIYFEKSRIRETLNLSTDADSSTNTKTDRNGQKGIIKYIFFWGTFFLWGVKINIFFKHFFVLVLLSASVERCFVSRMRDFLKLDGVGPVDNRPSTDQPHHSVRKNNKKNKNKMLVMGLCPTLDVWYSKSNAY